MAVRRRPVRALSIVVAVGTLAAFGTTAAHADPVYPSWQDVEDARDRQLIPTEMYAQIREQSGSAS